jgi:hypothetical protein
MTYTHTPGPWVLNDGRSTRVDLIDTRRGHAVGEIVWVDVRNPADARLIAAAPLMFEALRELCNDKYLSDPINTDRMKNARAAIAAATGAQT